jgi:peptidoglycan/LPS O-acetylase OafA/YrhL
MLVLFHHFTLYSGVQPSTYIDKLYFKLAEASWCGVDLFFVLSGFLITGILLRTKSRRGYFRNFYARRTLRIFPLYYVTLMILFGVGPLVMTPSPAFTTLLRERAWYFTYLTNVLYAREGWPDFQAVGHLWSLAVEEQFYLVWPWVVWVSRRRTLVLICLGMILLSPVLRVWLADQDQRVAAYVLMPARLDALAVGALLAVLSTEKWIRVRLSKYALIPAVPALTWIVAVTLHTRSLNAEMFDVVTFTLSCVALLFGALLASVTMAEPTSFIHRIFTGRLLTFLGRYSYGLYLFHVPLLFLIMPHVVPATSLQPTYGSVLPGVLLFTVIGTSLSILLAVASWSLLENPFLSLKRYFA